ncbi:MAG: tRNA (adenosine(37)-N6)-dimethylallyltransferase MiaA [Candidatus Paceibacterota bacterium]
MKNQLPRILVILGPTAIGKSDIAVELALKLGGEVISADSRQVYKGLDIGTGKITLAEMRGVPHHCLDIADPQDRFTAMDWKRAAEQAIDDILKRGKLPIVCGGTGFYISTLVDNLGFPEVEADTEEQKALEEKPVEELFEMLKKLDPKRALTIDLKNKRRLSRAIIIANKLGYVPPIEKPAEPKYEAIQIGLTMSNTQLKNRIFDRLVKRLEHGMPDEARKLMAAPPEGSGLTSERMDELGLEYRYLAQYLDNKFTLEHLIDELSTKIWQYAKRQMTWFKKDKRITWVYQPVDLKALIKLCQ